QPQRLADSSRTVRRHGHANAVVFEVRGGQPREPLVVLDIEDRQLRLHRFHSGRILLSRSGGPPVANKSSQRIRCHSACASDKVSGRQCPWLAASTKVLVGSASTMALPICFS